jgi:tRNA dimethylallyltransferase
VEKIWVSGLLNEVMSLREKGYGETHRVKGLIYGTAGEFLDGKLTRKGAIERTKYNVHSYVRRQQTWFKRNPGVEWFDILQDDFEEIIYNRVKENIKNG